MTDWYASSVAYSAVAQWAASHTYANGAIVRQLATPTVGNERCFQAIAGTFAVTWDPSYKGAGVVLSNGNLTATDGGSSATFALLRGTQPRSTGLFYYEATWSVLSPSDSGIGVCNSTLATNNYPGADANGVSAVNDGRLLSNGSQTANQFATWVASDVVCVAVDMTHGKFWVRTNAGNWNNDILINQNPATNTGGYAIPAGSVFPAVWLFINGDAVTINLGATTFAQTVPVGFAAWSPVTLSGVSGGSEPTWNIAKGGQTTETNVQWTECSGNSAQQQNGGVTNTWTAPIARVDTALNTFAFTSGDRLFVSSDHTQTVVGFPLFTQNGNNGVVISVDRTTGNIPPLAADITNGATLIATGSSATLSVNGGGFWQGLTFKAGGSTDTNCVLSIGGGGVVTKFLNCLFQLPSTALSGAIQIAPGSNPSLRFENCVYNFNNANQVFTVSAGRVTFIGGSSNPFPGAYPTNGIIVGGSLVDLKFHGIDFSVVPTGVYIVAPAQTWPAQVSLANCKIGVYTQVMPDQDQISSSVVCSSIDIINCDNSVGYRNEWYRPSGGVRTDPTAIHSGGASDGQQAVSHTYVTWLDSSANVPLAGPPMYIWNTVTGATKTATVEICSAATLNNNDVYLELEYLGDSGDPKSTIINDGIATILTTPAAVTSSAASWVVPMQWNPSAAGGIYLSVDNLTATAMPAGVALVARGELSAYQSSGKYYCEFTALTVGTASGWRLGVVNSGITLHIPLGNDANFSIGYGGDGVVSRNGSTQATLATYTTANLICMAVDLTNNKIWWRKGATGGWNNDVIGNQNPATNTGGVSISAITGPVLPAWSGSTNKDQVTVNFGATAFAGTPPAGFADWAPSPVTQKLQVSFTPQKVGLVRATVKLVKSFPTFVRVDPLITIT